MIGSPRGQLGDSHAGATGEAIEITARNAGMSGLLYSIAACPPGQISARPIATSDVARCLRRNAWVQNEILKDGQIRTVIIVAHWAPYADDLDGIAASLELSISQLQRAGKRVVIIADLPTPPWHVPEQAALSVFRHKPIPTTYAQPPRQERLHVLTNQTGARLISMASLLCDRSRCPVYYGGRPAFFDTNHVSGSASRQAIAPALQSARLFEDLPAGGD